MSARVLDMCYGVAILLCALVLYVAGGGNPSPVPVASNPFWYPKLLLVLMAVCAMWMLIRAVLERRGASPITVQWGALAGCVLITGAFLYGYDSIGFIPSAIPLVLALSWWLGFRKPVWLVIIAVLFTVGAWYCFADLLNRAPPGPALPSFTALFGS